MKAVLAALLLGCLALASSRAAAQCQDEACLRTSTQLANVNTQQSALLDAQFNSLLGTGSAVDLTVADDNALAGTSIKLSDLTAALVQAGVGADAATALDTAASLPTVLNAAASAANLEGNVTTSDALKKLATQAAAAGAGTIKLGDLLKVDTRSGPLANASLNALDFATGAASLFNSKNVASVNQVAITGSALGLGSSIANVQLATTVIEPAQFVCGPVGTQFFSANVRVRARVMLTGSGINLTVPPLTTVRLNLASFDLVAAVGRASGTIQAINAVAGTLTVSATPGIAELYLGTISDANFLDRTTAIDPVTELQPAVIGNLALSLLVVNASATVSAKGYAKGTNPTASTLNFTGPYPQTLTATTGANFASNLVDTLLSNLTVSVSTLSTSLPLTTAALNALLADLLTTVTSTLKSTSGILKPLLDSALTGAVDPLLSQLGIKLGEVSVTAERPYKVPVGATCNDLNFCTDNDVCGANNVCAGVVKTCSDGLDCTTDVCNGATGSCTNTPSASACLIGGACVASGAPDPSNSCRACNPSTLTTGYSNKTAGATCDDGLFCTGVDSCNALGVCTGALRDCSDSLACTVELCDELNDRCTTAVTIGCVVGGSCVLPGADDPSNPCRSCNPLLSSTVFSNKAAGALCADGLFCTTGDACDGAGSCTSAPRNCEDGLGCTQNSCNEAAGTCTSSLGGGCIINGACVAAGAPDPLNSCRSCNPAVSTGGYSNNGTGSACSDGLFCTENDSCNALGICTGQLKVCDPGGQGCTSICDELTDTCTAGTLGCRIDGACVAPLSDDPNNPCRSCVPTVSTTAWTNKAGGVSCSDSQYCTTNDACNGSGTCVGTARSCSDNLDCTTDTCDEPNDRCNAAVTGGCVIGGACVAAGTVDPSNPCQSCNPAVSPAAWTKLAAGTACDDGQFCTTGEVCNGEARCVGPARDCNAGGAGCASVCDEAGDRCRSDLSACVIDGACHAAGSVDSNNPCRECNPALAPNAWSNRAAGSSCDDGLYCTTDETCSAQGACNGQPRGCGGAAGTCGNVCNEALDTCSSGVSGCNIDGVCRASGDVDPSNSCRVCNPAQSTTAWSPKGAGTSCSDGLFCTSNETCNAFGVCAGTPTACSDGLSCTSETCDESARRCNATVSSGCLINGACYATNDPDPSNACRTCQPAVSTTAFTNLTAGATCDDARFCTVDDACTGQGVCAGTVRSCNVGGQCENFCDEGTDSCRGDLQGCAIGELCVAAGADDPGNSCRTCDPDLSTTDWSLKPAGTGCSDNLFCTSSDVCSGTGVCAGRATDCSDNQACTADACDESADACTHAAGSSCLINGQCVPAGTLDPTSSCRVCDPVSSTTGWTNAPINSSCSDGQFCTVVDACDGAGSCVGSGAACLSDATDCQQQICDETTDSCRVAVTVGCRINLVCVAAGEASALDACLVCAPDQSTSAYTFVGNSPGCARQDAGTISMQDPITPLDEDGGVRDAGFRDAAAVGPVDDDVDGGIGRTGGLAGGALCSLSAGESSSPQAAWLVLMAWGGLTLRRRRRS